MDIKTMLDEDLTALQVGRQLVVNSDDYEISLYDTGEERLHCNFYDTGASKLVLVFDDKVYKIPATGREYYAYNHELDEYEEEPFIEDFFNHCEKELEVYEKAVIAGLSDCFPKTVFFGEINGLEIYEAERVDNDCPNDFDSLDEKEKEKINTSIENSKKLCYGEMPHYLLREFINYYGVDYCERLQDFLCENCVDDICERNCGTLNGRPVILDFSGFLEDC